MKGMMDKRAEEITHKCLCIVELHVLDKWERDDHLCN